MKIQIHTQGGINGTLTVRTGKEINAMYGSWVLQNDMKFNNIELVENLLDGDVIVYKRNGDGSPCLHMLPSNRSRSFLEACNVTIVELWRPI